MIDPRLAWFAIGASCSAVMLGWPWHPRFSRRMGPPKGSYCLPPNHSWRVIRSITFPDPEPGRQPINPFTGGPVKLAATIESTNEPTP